MANGETLTALSQNPQNPPKKGKLEKVYDFLKTQEKFKVHDTYQEFETAMQNEGKLQKVYEYLKTQPRVKNVPPTFEGFRDSVVKKKEVQLPTDTDQLSQQIMATSQAQDPVQEFLEASQEPGKALSAEYEVAPGGIDIPTPLWATDKAAAESPEMIRQRAIEERTISPEAQARQLTRSIAEEQELEQQPPGALESVESAAGAFNRPVVELVSSLPKTSGLIINQMDRLLASIQGKEKPDVETNPLYQAGQWLDDKALEVGITATNPKLDDSFFFSDVPSAFGSAFAIMMSGGRSGVGKAGLEKVITAPKGLLGNTKVAAQELGKTLASRPVVAGGLMMGTSEYEQAIAAGVPEEEAFGVFLKNYAIGQTEAIPIERYLSRINKLSGGKIIDVIKAGGVGSIEEAAQEGMQNYLTNNVARGTYDPQREPFKDMIRSMGAGAFVGFFLPGIGKAMEKMTPEQREATKKELNEAFKEVAPEKAEAIEQSIQTPEGLLGEEEGKKEEGIKEEVPSKEETKPQRGKGKAAVTPKAKTDEGQAQTDETKAEAQRVLTEEQQPTEGKEAAVTTTEETKTEEDAISEQSTAEVPASETPTDSGSVEEGTPQPGPEEAAGEEVPIQDEGQPATTQEGQEIEPAVRQSEQIGQEVEFERFGKTKKGKVLGTDERGKVIIQDSEGIKFRVAPEEVKELGKKTVKKKKKVKPAATKEEIESAKPKTEEEIVQYKSPKKQQIGIVGSPKAGFSFGSDTIEKLVEKAGPWIKKQFTSKGYLPQYVFDRWIKTKGETSKYEAQVRFTVGDIKKAIKQEYKGKPTDEQITDMNLFLQGKKPVNPIPAKTKALLSDMRAQVDNLSRRFINEGVISGDLTATFTDNLGTYLTRSYRKFDDPFWAEFVDPKVRTNAEGFIRNNSIYRGQRILARATRLRDREIKKADVIKKLEEEIKALSAPFTKKPSARISPKGVKRVLSKNAEQVKELQKRLDALKNRDFLAEAQELEKQAKQAINVTPQEIEGLINFLLYDPKAPTSILKGVKLGSKDLSILKKRGEIAPEIRALMGEYSDPLLNYARTITKMSNLIAKHHFLQDVKAEGMGQFLFKDKTGEYFVPIAAEGSKTMAPLNGLYTTKEIAEAFNDFNNLEPTNVFFKAWLKINGYIKSGKTVFSAMTHARNFFGNLGFVVMNGHWRLDKFGKAAQTAWANVYSNNQAIRDKFKEYLELGVVQDSGAAGELKQYLEDIRAGRDFFESINENRLNKAKRTILETSQNLYQFEDDLYKVFAFENEYARYKKAMPNATDQQVKEKAAKIVRDTYPTYSMVPKIVKAFRANPLVGSFVSFPAEVLRTTYNTIALAKEELSNPSTRAIGIQRSTGILLSMFGTSAASYGTMALLGLDGEDDEDIRKFVAPWQRDSEFLYTKVSGDKWKIIDMGYSDPHSYIKRPFYNLFKGDTDSLLDDAAQASWSLLEPFLSEEILTERMIDFSRNQKKNGDHVYNPDGDLGDKVTDTFLHFYGGAEIGTMSSLRRIYKAATDETNVYGQKYELSNEVIGLMFGMKEETKDITQSLLYRAYDFRDRISATQKDLYRVTKSASASPEDKQEAQRKYDAAVRRIKTDAVATYRAAIRLGVDPKQARRTMYGTKSKEIIKAIKGSN